MSVIEPKAKKQQAPVKRRFIAKQRDRTWWVYDVDRAAWPAVIPYFGVVKNNFRTEAECLVEADRLEKAVNG